MDIAIDNMTGSVFLNHFMEFLISEPISTSSFGIIASNPEKSKHLETATIKINNMTLDFVNLRSEVYDLSSRIPNAIKFGSAIEDSFRRDITINSLFFNIHMNSIEDFTKLVKQNLFNYYS